MPAVQPGLLSFFFSVPVESWNCRVGSGGLVASWTVASVAAEEALLIDNSVKRLKLGRLHLCFHTSVPWQHLGEVGASVTAGRRGVKIAWELVEGMAVECTREHWTCLGFS